jgi:ankyrin repeat protein
MSSINFQHPFTFSQHGWNALMSAASRGHTPIVEYLLQMRANALVLDKHDADALTYARKNKHSVTAHMLDAAIKSQTAAVS